MHKTIITLWMLIWLALSACAPTAVPTEMPAASESSTTAPPESPPTTAAFTPEATIPPLEPSFAFLHVQGRDIVDAGGQPIYLRGINFHTNYYLYRWDPNAPWDYATQEDIRYIKSLGANVIRLGFHWRYFDTSLGFDLIDAYLNWCEQAGIYVILDMHVVPPEEDILQGKIWDDPAAQQQFLDLWKAIAARYAERTIVAGYDLYNEPAPPDPAQWWNLAERAIAAIRTVDDNHILFIEAPLSGEGVGLQLVSDPNVVYSYHDYSPVTVSHAGAAWLGDSAVPTQYSYPGEILTGTRWVDFALDAAEFTGQTGEWLYWDSGDMTVPSGVEFATLRLSVHGPTGAVWFDDLELWRNGVPQTLYNAGMEEESALRPGEPANWHFWSDGGFSGEWSSEQSHSGAYSLKIIGDGEYGVWVQSEWIFTKPLFRVQAGDTLRVRGWILVPENNGGSVSLRLDYLNGIYERYDRERLHANIQPYADWAAANNVPLWMGEFGAMSSAPGDSRYALIADTISVMNELGLHWTLWAYQDGEPPSFGLYLGDDLDERLEDILKQGWRR